MNLIGETPFEALKNGIRIIAHRLLPEREDANGRHLPRGAESKYVHLDRGLIMIVNAMIVLGAVIAGTVAFEPHFSSAYRIQFGVLAASLLPYLLYAAIAASVHKPWVGLVGIGLVTTHVLMLARPQWWESVWGIDTAIYGIPLALSIVLLPIVYYATRPAWAGKDAG